MVWLHRCGLISRSKCWWVEPLPKIGCKLGRWCHIFDAGDGLMDRVFFKIVWSGKRTKDHHSSLVCRECIVPCGNFKMRDSRCCIARDKGECLWDFRKAFSAYKVKPDIDAVFALGCILLVVLFGMEENTTDARHKTDQIQTVGRWVVGFIST